ncbi:VCBS repeat-containing protein [Candidatus Pacearchaeota archaeon]|nr:VCBS repeat-containing protein [Candidatus Pacearchaeota archaeon]
MRSTNIILLSTVFLCALYLVSAVPILPHVFDTAVAQPKNLDVKDNARVDLFTGSAAYSYPIAVPPGTHGLQPSIVLSYSSQSLGQRPESIGAGWGLSENYIQRVMNKTVSDTSDDSFRLVLDGLSHELVYSDGRYHTKLESFLHISNYSGGENTLDQHWIVKSPDGKVYRFGFYNFSEMLSNQGNYVWRWSLDRVNDTYGNSIIYNYTENPYAEDQGSVYLNQIQYNNDLQRKVAFVYESTSRPDAWTVYEEGNKIVQSRRVSSIDVYANGSLVSSYRMRYALGGTNNSLSFIANITRVGSDNATVLPPVSFGYFSLQNGWSLEDSWDSPICFSDDTGKDKGARHLDVNGDGLIDIVKGQEVSSQCNITVRETYLNNRTAWEQTELYEIPTCFVNSEGVDTFGVRFGDVNGDGLQDIIKGVDLATCNSTIYLNNGTGWSADATRTLPAGACFVDDVGTDIGARTVDVNGDGLIDILVGIISGGQCPSSQRAAYINNGTGWVQNDLWEPPECFVGEDGSDYGIRISDVNGDGLPDILRGIRLGGSCTTAQRNAYINNGTGWVQDETFEPPVCFYTDDFADLGVRLADANGDKLTDLLVSIAGSGSCAAGDRTTYINNGTNWVQNDLFEPPDCFANQFGQPDDVRVVDANGDGTADYIKSRSGSSCTSGSKQTYLSNTTKVFLLRTITTSLGGNITIDYQRSTFLSNVNASTGRSELDFNVYVVANITEDNGVNGSQRTQSITTYNYSGGEYNHVEKEFRGFSIVEERNDARLIRHLFHQDVARKGREYVTETFDLNGNPYQRSEQEWNYTQTSSIYETRLLGISEIAYDGSLSNPKIKNISYSYDIFENILLVNNSGDISVSGDERYEYSTYLNNSQVWILNTRKNYSFVLPNGTKLRETLYSYDGLAYGTAPTKGSVSAIEQWLETGNNPITNYSHDGFGNVINVTDPRGNLTSYIYGINDSTHTFANRIVNARGQRVEYNYSLGTGALLATVDANGISTTHSYDIFGRKVNEIFIYDNLTYPTVEYTYYFDGTAPEGMAVKKREQNGTILTLDEYQFYDGFGRTLQTKRESDDSSKQIVLDVYYDNTSRIVRQSLPYLGALDGNYTAPNQSAGFINYTYDAIDRAIRTTNADGSFKNMSYQHWESTMHDEENNRRDQTLDAYGKITYIRLYNSNISYLTRYTYDGASQVTAIIDSLNNTINYTHDTLGRKIRMSDPDVGIWNYSYDVGGNLIVQTDARNTTLTLGYDSLNRKIQESDSSGTVLYIYDGSLNGTLSQIATNSMNMSYVYDSRLRKTREVKNISGISFTTSFSYDSLNRKISEELPSGETLTYLYGLQGLPGSLKGVVNASYNQINAPLNFTYANAQVTNYTYNGSTFRIQSINTGNKQHLIYQYDALGSVMQINDSIHAILRSMRYDDIDRLLHANSTGTGHEYVFDFAYNEIGNMLQSNRSANSTTYYYGASPKHAPRSVQTTAFV